jgi:hypothetical protein
VLGSGIGVPWTRGAERATSRFSCGRYCREAPFASIARKRSSGVFCQSDSD